MPTTKVIAPVCKSTIFFQAVTTTWSSIVIVLNAYLHRPILTYGGKACNKNGVKPAKHGIIYEYGHRARMLDGEPKLGFPAVQARITEDGERLSKESRVNYSKLVTVEHNVNVFFIGSIAPESWPSVEDAVNDCWYQKVHQRRRN